MQRITRRKERFETGNAFGDMLEEGYEHTRTHATKKQRKESSKRYDFFTMEGLL